MDNAPAFIIGLIFGCFVMAAINTVDIPTDNMFKAIDICETHDGLKFYDGKGNFTCSDGLIFQLRGHGNE